MKLIEIYDNDKIFVNLEDIRGQWINDQNGTQKDKVKLLKKICIKEKIKNFYDLGSNYGEFSCHLSKYVENVFCFEPNPITYECLVETSKMYDNMKTFEQAAYNKHCKKEFYFNTKYSGGGRLGEWRWKDMRYKQFHDEKFYISKKVQCVDFLSFFKETNKKKSCLIKIDIEGFEMQIINNLKELLNTMNKWFIYFESDKTTFKPDDLPGKILIRTHSDTLIGKINQTKEVM